MERKVQFACRIRPPLLKEQYGGNQGDSVPKSTSKTAKKGASSDKQLDSRRQSQAKKQSEIKKASSLQKDFKSSVFTVSGANSLGRIVAVSSNPIKNELLNQYIQRNQDLSEYQTSILENANLYELDLVFNPRKLNESVYDTLVRANVQQAINGMSSTIFLAGPPKGGKDYTFRGTENCEAGLIVLAVQDLLNLMQISKQQTQQKSQKPQFQLQSEFFCVLNNDVIDLSRIIGLNGSKNKATDNQALLKQIHVNAEQIQSLGVNLLTDFKQFYKQSVAKLRNLGESLPKKAHIFVRLNVLRSGSFLSSLTFAKLADFAPQNEDFPILARYLTEIATKPNQPILAENTVYMSKKIIQVLADNLNNGEDNRAVFLINVSSSKDTNKLAEKCIDLFCKARLNILNYYKDNNLHQSALQNSSFPVRGLPSPKSRTPGSPHMTAHKRASPQSFRASPAQERQERGTPTRDEMNIQTILNVDIEAVTQEVFDFTQKKTILSEPELREWIISKQNEVEKLQLDLNQLNQANFTQKTRENLQKLEEAAKFLHELRFSGDDQRNNSPPAMFRTNKNFRQSAYSMSPVKSVSRSPQRRRAASPAADMSTEVDQGLESNLLDLRRQQKTSLDLLQNHFLAALTRKNGPRGLLEERIQNEENIKIIRKLKEAQDQIELLENEKRHFLRERNRSLREALFNEKGQTEVYQQENVQKDSFINNLEIQMSDLREENGRQRDEIVLLNTKDQENQDLQEQMRDIIQKLKNKTNQKKNQIQTLNQEYVNLEQDLKDEKVRFQQEIQLHEQKIAYLEKGLEDERLQSSEQQFYLDQLQKDFQQKDKKLEKSELQVQELEQKLRDQKKLLLNEQSQTYELQLKWQNSEKKNSDLKEKLAATNKKIEQMKEKQLDERRRNIDQSTLIRSQSNQVLLKQPSLSPSAHQEEYTSNQYQQLRSELRSLRSVIDEQAFTIKDLKSQLGEIGDEKNKLLRTIDIVQKEKEQARNVLMMNEQSRAQTAGNLTEYQQNNRAQNEYISKLEKQNEILQEMSMKEMSQLLAKVEKQTFDLQKNKEENAFFRENLSQTEEMLEKYKLELEMHKDKLIQKTCENQTQKEHLIELNQHMRKKTQKHPENTRSSQIRNYLKDKNIQLSDNDEESDEY